MYPRSLSIATRLDSPQYQSTKATRINYLPPPHLLACHPAAPFTQGQHLVLSLCTDPRFLRASVSTGRIPSGSAEGSCLPDRPRGEAQDHRRACPHAHLLDWGWGGGGRGALQSPFWVSRSRKPANASAHSAPTREVKLRRKELREKQKANKSPESTTPRFQLHEQLKTQSLKLMRVDFSVTRN